MYEYLWSLCYHLIWNLYHHRVAWPLQNVILITACLKSSQLLTSSPLYTFHALVTDNYITALWPPMCCWPLLYLPDTTITVSSMPCPHLLVHLSFTFLAQPSLFLHCHVHPGCPLLHLPGTTIIVTSTPCPHVCWFTSPSTWQNSAHHHCSFYAMSTLVNLSFTFLAEVCPPTLFLLSYYDI